MCVYTYIYIYSEIMKAIRHWPSKAGMLTESRGSDEEDGRIGLS